MPTNYSNPLCLGLLLLTVIFYLCVGYSYYLNEKREPNDPKRLDIPLGVVLLAPITWPFALIGAISLIIIRILIYGVLLILFVVAVIVIRKPFFFAWLKKTAAWIGDGLLKANLFFLKIAVGSHSKKTETT